VRTRIGRSHIGSALALTAIAAIASFASGSAGAAPKAPQRVNLYSITTEEQFLNHADDRQRGFGDNPFGNFKAPTPTTKERNAGPFPGDQALFTFKLYSAANRKKPVGLALFSCTYSFNQQGFCDAAWQLKDGTVIGSGPVDFNAKNFSLVITGGTSKYRGVTGNVVSKASPKVGAVNLAFTLD
jgi:hypothetical protein